MASVPGPGGIVACDDESSEVLLETSGVPFPAAPDLLRASRLFFCRSPLPLARPLRPPLIFDRSTLSVSPDPGPSVKSDPEAAPEPMLGATGEAYVS